MKCEPTGRAVFDSLPALLVLGAAVLVSCSGSTRKPQGPPVQINKRVLKKIVPGGGNDPGPMAFIEAGPFFRGSAPGVGEEDERPRRLIIVDAFYIDQYEVTVGSYRHCVSTGVCSPPNTDENCNWGLEGREEHPINCVSWYQAKKYCAWAGKRLPTAAEWEKAARGLDERHYSWGDQTPSCELANFNASRKLGKDAYCHGQTVPVTRYAKAASPYGAVQMTGNVYEWINDWYDKDFYAVSPQRNPRGPLLGKHRGVRGGSWFSLVKDLRSALRGLVPPAIRLPYLGFRCAMEHAPSSLGPVKPRPLPPESQPTPGSQPTPESQPDSGPPESQPNAGSPGAP